MKSSFSNQRQSAPTGAQEHETKQEADRPLGGAACCALEFLEKVVPMLDDMMQKKGLGRVTLSSEFGVVEFRFGHCSIGLAGLKKEHFGSFVTDRGLLIPVPFATGPITTTDAGSREQS